jgi:MFS family permease
VTARRVAGSVVVAMMSNTIAVLPVFLTAALAVLIRRELGFGEARLGLAVSGYFMIAALASVPGGRLAERRGAAFAMALSTTVSAAGMVGIALAARSWAALAVLLGISGISNGVAQPSSNLAIAQIVSGDRQGVAFGVKQAAIPIGTMLSGLAVPAFGLTVGWRWGFVAGAVLAIPFCIACARLPIRAERRSGPNLRQGDASTGPMILLATCCAIAAATDTALGGFYVESVVASGVEPGTAGLMFAGGSLAGIGGRVLWGWIGDRVRGGRLRIVGALMTIGAVGIALLGLSTQPVVLGLATLLAFGCGWGWNGLFNFAVVRLNPRAPGAATGITQTGIFVGGVVGPLGFGAIVESGSYRLAWTAATAALLAAAALVGVSRRVLLTDRERRAAPA